MSAPDTLELRTCPVHGGLFRKWCSAPVVDCVTKWDGEMGCCNEEGEPVEYRRVLDPLRGGPGR